MLSPDDIKRKVGVYSANLVHQGMTIGLGTGSTAYWLINELGKRVKEGLEVTVVPTSLHTKKLAQESGITVSDLEDVTKITLTIDGADEIDTTGQLIKGGGGALLQEKIVAHASDQLIIIADSSKLVTQLGKFPLPVEVIPFGYRQVREEIMRSPYCKMVSLRQKDGKPFLTDHHHYILDCACKQIANATLLNSFLQAIPGIVETGLFINMASRAIIGYEDGRIEEIKYK